jgi:hypothetical protein
VARRKGGAGESAVVDDFQVAYCDANMKNKNNENNIESTYPLEKKKKKKRHASGQQNNHKKRRNKYKNNKTKRKNIVTKKKKKS